MARPQNSPILAQLRNAKSLPEQTAALQALKNEIVGHVQKKEAWIGLGVLEPIVRTLYSNRSPAKLNGKDATVQPPSRPLSDEDSVKLQALQLVASFANGGPAFLHPLHAARVVPAILGNISPYTSPPQVVVSSLRALLDITSAARLAVSPSPLDVQTLADNVFSSHHIESLHAMLSMTSSKYILQSQVVLASTLISRLCREDRHQHALTVGGILDSLAAQLARFAVADGLVVPGAEEHAYSDGLHEVFPEAANPGAQIGPILEAISCIIGDSKYRANRLICSPSLLAIFPSIKFEPYGDPRDSQQALPPRHNGLTAMEFILPSLPITTSRTPSAAASSFPTPDRSDSRTSSRTSLSKFGSSAVSAVWDSPRFQALGNTVDVSNEDIESPFIPWLIHLVRSLNDYDRLMAAAVLAALFKAGLGRKGVRETSIGLLVVPILVGMISKNDKDGVELLDSFETSQLQILEKAPAILARTITDSEYLQKAAFDCDAVKVLTRLLRRAYQPVEDMRHPKYWSPNPDTGMDVESTLPLAQLGENGQNPLLAHRIRIRESALKAIGALSAGKEDYRKALIAEDFIPFVVESLSEFPRKPKQAKDKSLNETARTGPVSTYGTNPQSVIIAGCHVVRTLARSVSILRTALVDHAVSIPIFRFMSHPDITIQIAATATVINLVVEVSPVRELLTESGVMKVLCDHAHSDNHSLRLNALWALKHFVDAVGPDLKKACLEQLQPGWLMQLIRDDDQETSFFALKAKESSADDLDEDMDMQQSDEPLRWFFGTNGTIRELDASRSSRLRQVEDRLASVREAELNPTRKTRNDKLAIQEQGLDFIRNFIGRPESGVSSEAPSETTDMIDHLFSQLGQDRLFEILASKLRSKVLHPFSRRTPVSAGGTRVLHPQAKIIVAVICILVHMAASIHRHRQLVIAQTELLKLLAQQVNSKDRGVRVSLCHLVINLTWHDDETEAQACSHRAQELKRLGFYSKMETLKQHDRDLDVRERAKTATFQIDQATY
ncbi:armadillo repeat protein [Metarhizium brunneum]